MIFTANGVSVHEILNTLDSFLHKNDYISAEKYLLQRLNESRAVGDNTVQLLVMNELMGLYRKLGNRQEALSFVNCAMEKIEEIGAQAQIGSATTYLNCATVYKAFGMAEQGLPLYRRAQAIYERNLAPTDSRLGGLYNNMALALVDMEQFCEAFELYEKAISIMLSNSNGEPEAAITYLNKANAVEAQVGLLDGAEEITHCLEKAKELLEEHSNRDGNYAFVCEKCATVYGYYGDFLYEEELAERSRRIYERS